MNRYKGDQVTTPSGGKQSYMRFTEQSDKMAKERQVWNDVAFKICSKSKDEIKEFVKRVAEY
jgi:hypothetical protein